MVSQLFSELLGNTQNKNMRTKNYKDIGEVLYVKNKRAKNITISIKPMKGVRVSVPQSVSFFKAEQFLKSNLDWLKENIKKIKELETKKYIIDGKSNIETKNHTIKILRHQSSEHKGISSNNIISIYIPQEIDITNQDTQKFIRETIEQVYRFEAKKYIPQRLFMLAQKHNFYYNKIKITSAKTKWGSCSSKDSINISLQVMKLPYHLIDYILLHELCHTVEKNHSANFWNLLETVYPNPKNERNELKKFGMFHYH